MDAGGLPASLLKALSGVELVEAVDFDTEAFVLEKTVEEIVEALSGVSDRLE